MMHSVNILIDSLNDAKNLTANRFYLETIMTIRILDRILYLVVVL